MRDLNIVDLPEKLGLLRRSIIVLITILFVEQVPLGVNIFIFIFFGTYHMDFLGQQLEEFVVGIDLDFLVRPLIVVTFVFPMREVVLFDLLLDYFLHLKTTIEA